MPYTLELYEHVGHGDFEWLEAAAFSDLSVALTVASGTDKAARIVENGEVVWESARW